jgi:hypothetical protein
LKKLHTLALAFGLSLPLSAYAQEAHPRVSLSITEAAHPVAVDPGGEVIVRGAVRSSHDGSVIDALTTRPGATGVEGDGEPVPGGLYDIEAGGWRLVSRDVRAHAYRLAATGNAAPACVEAGVASPCLPLRLLPLAQSRLLAVADFARSVSGEITLEVLDPDSTPVAAPPFVTRYGAPMGVGALALVGAFALARTLRRRSQTPEAKLRRTAAKVRARLASGDPVHRQLAPSVDALVTHADELASLRDRLRTRVANTDRAALTIRREAADAQVAKGVADSTRARDLVDEQLARLDRWSREADRAEARIGEVHEYLLTLSQRLEESIGAEASAREASTREALAELEAEVQSALEGAREADAIARGA